LAFALAIGSAFTTKLLFNPTGWTEIGHTIYNGPTDDPRCAVNNGPVDCFIVISGVAVSPVYDSVTDIGDPLDVLTHPNP